MEGAAGISRKLTIILFIISFSGFLFNIAVYTILHRMILERKDIAVFTDKISIVVGLGFIFLLLFHLVGAFAVILKLREYSKASVFLSLIFFLAVVSSIMIFGDLALLSDITKEYSTGLIEGIYSEFLILYSSQFLHLVFYIFILALLLNWDKYSISSKDQVPSLKDEAIFNDVQYIGILTSLCGLAILAALSIFTPLWAIKKGIILLCILLVLPYAAVVVYWLILKIRERITEWYDEKQFQDVTKAAFISFLASMIILAAVFLVQNLWESFTLINVVWFPFYFFLVLLLFSSIILYFNKKAEEQSNE